MKIFLIRLAVLLCVLLCATFLAHLIGGFASVMGFPKEPALLPGLALLVGSVLLKDRDTRQWTVFGGVLCLNLSAFLLGLIGPGWFFPFLFLTFGVFWVERGSEHISLADKLLTGSGNLMLGLGVIMLVIRVIAYFA